MYNIPMIKLVYKTKSKFLKHKINTTIHMFIVYYDFFNVTLNPLFFYIKHYYCEDQKVIIIIVTLYTFLTFQISG